MSILLHLHQNMNRCTVPRRKIYTAIMLKTKQWKNDDWDWLLTFMLLLLHGQLQPGHR
jgi:ABC-type nickel/cobalt efflux system permease component RcnA